MLVSWPKYNVEYLLRDFQDFGRHASRISKTFIGSMTFASMAACGYSKRNTTSSTTTCCPVSTLLCNSSLPSHSHWLWYRRWWRSPSSASTETMIVTLCYCWAMAPPWSLDVSSYHHPPTSPFLMTNFECCFFLSCFRADRMHYMGLPRWRPRLDAKLGAQRHGFRLRFGLCRRMLPAAMRHSVYGRGTSRALQAPERDRNAWGECVQHRRRYQTVSTATSWTCEHINLRSGEDSSIDARERSDFMGNKILICWDKIVVIPNHSVRYEILLEYNIIEDAKNNSLLSQELTYKYYVRQISKGYNWWNCSVHLIFTEN